MTTKECPSHHNLSAGLLRIITESVTETLSETEMDIAGDLYDRLHGEPEQTGTPPTAEPAVDHPAGSHARRRG